MWNIKEYQAGLFYLKYISGNRNLRYRKCEGNIVHKQETLEKWWWDKVCFITWAGKDVTAPASHQYFNQLLDEFCELKMMKFPQTFFFCSFSSCYWSQAGPKRKQTDIFWNSSTPLSNRWKCLPYAIALWVLRT